MNEAVPLVERADRVLVWLKILTIFIGGMGTVAVVFLADVYTARLTNPVYRVAGVEKVALSEDMELHSWLGYKLGVAAQDDKDVVFHVKKAFDLATTPNQKSNLDSILVEHMPAGHFIHTKNILKEMLGTNPEPSQVVSQLEARVALALIKQNKMDAAQEQVEHMITVVPAKEVAQQALEALKKGDMESAGQLLTGLAGG